MATHVEIIIKLKRKKLRFTVNALNITKFFNNKKRNINDTLLEIEKAFVDAYERGTAIWIIADDMKLVGPCRKKKKNLL